MDTELFLKYLTFNKIEFELEKGKFYAFLKTDDQISEIATFLFWNFHKMMYSRKMFENYKYREFFMVVIDDREFVFEKI